MSNPASQWASDVHISSRVSTPISLNYCISTFTADYLELYIDEADTTIITFNSQQRLSACFRANSGLEKIRVRDDVIESGTQRLHMKY